MLRIKLTDGTIFQWELKEGLLKLAGDWGIADLARLQLHLVEFVEANSDEKKFITDNFPNIRITKRGTTRWTGDDAQFLANMTKPGYAKSIPLSRINIIPYSYPGTGCT